MELHLTSPLTGEALRLETPEPVKRGLFAPTVAAGVRKAMPPKGRWSEEYAFGKFRRGDYVAYAGARWRVYDAEAQGHGFTLFLVSTDAAEWARGVAPADVVPEHRRA